MAKGRRDACLQAGGGRAGVWVALDTHPPPCRSLGALHQAAKLNGAGAKGLPQWGASPP